MKRGAVLVNTRARRHRRRSGARRGAAQRPPRRRRARRVRRRAAAGRNGPRRLPEPAPHAAHRRPHGRGQRARLVPRRGQGRRGARLMARLGLDEARRRVAGALEHAGANPAMAEATARALVLAEAQGLGSHGLGRVPQYATHLRNGASTARRCRRSRDRRGPWRWSTPARGLAFGACELAVVEAMRRAREHGIGFAGVVRSHHAGVMVDHLRPAVAEAWSASPSRTRPPPCRRPAAATRCSAPTRSPRRSRAARARRRS